MSNAIKLAEQFETIAKGIRQAIVDGNFIFPQVIIPKLDKVYYADVVVELSGPAENIKWDKPTCILTYRLVDLTTKEEDPNNFAFEYHVNGKQFRSKSNRILAEEVIKSALPCEEMAGYSLIDQNNVVYTPDSLVDLNQTKQFSTFFRIPDLVEEKPFPFSIGIDEYDYIDEEN